MKLLKAEIERREGFANEPKLQITVDKIPAMADYKFTEKKLDKGSLYFAEHDGAVAFFSHSPNNQWGYGGSTFKLNMEDGSTKSIKGPWSSRSGVMNHYFKPNCVDCIVIEGGSSYKRSMAVSIDLAVTAAQLAGVSLRRVERRNDVVYVIEEN